jgi:hypothetical protein
MAKPSKGIALYSASQLSEFAKLKVENGRTFKTLYCPQTPDSGRFDSLAVERSRRCIAPKPPIPGALTASVELINY